MGNSSISHLAPVLTVCRLLGHPLRSKQSLETLTTQLVPMGVSMEAVIRAFKQLLRLDRLNRWQREAQSSQALFKGAPLVFVQLAITTFRVIKKVLDSDNSGSCLLF